MSPAVNFSQCWEGYPSFLASERQITEECFAHLLSTCLLFTYFSSLSDFPTPLLTFPGTTSQVNYLHSNPALRISFSAAQTRTRVNPDTERVKGIMLGEKGKESADKTMEGDRINRLEGPMKSKNAGVRVPEGVIGE